MRPSPPVDGLAPIGRQAQRVRPALHKARNRFQRTDRPGMSGDSSRTCWVLSLADAAPHPIELPRIWSCARPAHSASIEPLIRRARSPRRGPPREGGEDEAGDRRSIGARNHGLGVELGVGLPGGVATADEYSDRLVDGRLCCQVGTGQRPGGDDEVVIEGEIAARAGGEPGRVRGEVDLDRTCQDIKTTGSSVTTECVLLIFAASRQKCLTATTFAEPRQVQ
jgi:hypothetical protein